MAWENYTDRLTLNLKKTHFLDFSCGIREDINLQLNGQDIRKQKETKYLGLTITDDLRWEKHISNTIKELNKLIPIYYSLRNSLSKRKLLMLFNSLSFSKINYAIEIYGKRNNKWLTQLQKTQNRLLNNI